MPRKQAFSGKQKKQQLQVKRQGKQEYSHEAGVGGRTHSAKHVGLNQDDGASDSGKQKSESTSSSSFFQSKLVSGRGEVGRYALMFRPESKEEVNKRKEDAMKTIYSVDSEYLECQLEDFFSSELDFPVRPKWDYNLSPTELENQEKRYFNSYLGKIDTAFVKTELSYFELNLETWRQFWRVLEMSDILLCIVDIRFPPLLFPPKLYEYACEKLGKHIILLLNKIDLAPAELVLAWKEYFQNKYPQLEIICFTSYPSYNLHGNENTASMKGRRRRGKLRMAAEGALELFKVCEKIVSGQVNINRWREKILEEMNSDDRQEEEAEIKIESRDSIKPDTGFYEFKKFSDGILTIGCIGQPNVGKSSVINALMGKKVVSVSKTPGHTKHFQTIFLTPNVRLCDCPGLIFPSKVPKPLQVLCGSYPIAQLREPYSTVKYLAERIDLVKILAITHPEGEEEWCAYDVADGWAQKRGFHVAKTSRLDSYRGANHILRLALDGRICICLRPPGYTINEEKWREDTRISEIQYIQAKSSIENVVRPVNNEEFSETESDDEDAIDESRSSRDVNQPDDKRKTGRNREDETDSADDDESHYKAPIRIKNKFQLLNDMG